MAGLSRSDILASYTAPPHRIGEEEFERFLEGVRAARTITSAARRAGFSPQSFKYRIERDDDWRARYELALEEGAQRLADRIEGAMRERAIEGWDEPVFHEGMVVGAKRRYSDRLLERLAERHVDGYERTSRVEVTGGTEHTVKIEGGVRLGAVVEVLAAVGALPAGVALDALPAAAPVLAEPADDQPAARSLPSPRAT